MVNDAQFQSNIISFCLESKVISGIYLWTYGIAGTKWAIAIVIQTLFKSVTSE